MVCDPAPIPHDEMQRTYDWLKSWDMLEETASPLALVNLQVAAAGAYGRGGVAAAALRASFRTPRQRRSGIQKQILIGPLDPGLTRFARAPE